ncbi:universal stress protein [Nocardia asteroides]|uniref:universal stress protein n=1 Tax=Nocardia asteroides TaxID=1824 RepID=UPI0033EF5B06
MNAPAHHEIRRHIDKAPVVAAVDGSPTAIRAAQWAAVAARARHAPLRLVHVVRRRASVPRGSDVLAEAHRSVVDRWARTSAAPPPDITELTLCGNPAAALIELSAAASELVVGSVGSGSAAWGLLGSVATSVASAAHSPLTVVRPLPCAAAAVGPVLAVVDPASSGAGDALAAAVRAAYERATEVVVIELARPVVRASPGNGADVEATITELRRHFPTVRISVLSYFGHARTALEKFGGTAQLIVVPRDPRALRPFLHGMARTALWHTRCAVTVVPPSITAPTGIDRLLGRAHGFGNTQRDPACQVPDQTVGEFVDAICVRHLPTMPDDQL